MPARILSNRRARVNFHFNKETHTYTLNGRVIPSVTQVLKDQGILQISDFYTGPDVGNEVHRLCEKVDCDMVPELNGDEAVVNRVRAYEKFKEDSGFIPILIERSYYHKQLYFGGTIDRVGKSGGQVVLFDIKTGVKNIASLIQLVAYRELIQHDGGNANSCFTLYLKADGRYVADPVLPSEMCKLWNVFASALSVWHFRNNNNLIGE
jgi:hypothetical protein